MPVQIFTRRGLWRLAVGAACVAAPPQLGRAQTPKPVRIRASITAAGPDTLTLKTRAGETVTVGLPADTVLTAIVGIKLEDIKQGSFVGSAAMPQPDGTQRALEVHVFPESMRGRGEGHRPFDLQPQSTMTNGTVGAVTGSVGRTLTVSYQGGQQTIVVPPETPVVTYETGTRDLLVTGAHLVLFGNQTEDGKITANRISVGKDGLVPPM